MSKICFVIRNIGNFFMFYVIEKLSTFVMKSLASLARFLHLN